MNLLLAFVLYYVFFAFTNFKSFNIPLLFDYNFRFGNTSSINTVVTSFDNESPASKGGIELGEAIIEINQVPVYSVTDVKRELADKAGQEVSVLLLDLKDSEEDSLRTVTVSPKEGPDGSAILGVFLSKSITLDYSQGLNRILAGPLHGYNMLGYSIHVFKELIGASFETKSAAPISEGVSGPVGIYSVLGTILDYGGGRAFLNIIDFVALMSLSLAFLNIMPFPALDGGRLVFVLFEMFTKKKASLHIEALVHKWGMFVLLGLILLITIKDIGNLFG